jgi:hypothetical protein
MDRAWHVHYTRAVLQGAFILAKAKGEAEIAADSIDHLIRYLEPKGEITMRKAFAINYVTHDGVMQSPGAFQ